MDTKTLFAKTIESAAGCIKHIRVDEYDNPTPCSEWNLNQLLNHLVYELVWMPPLLEGQTITEVGDQFEGDLISDDPQGAWQKAADAALAAVEKADLSAVVHVSAGDITAEQYIKEMSNDVLIHGWDIGQALHCSVVFDEAVAQADYDNMTPLIQSFREHGAIGDEVQVADNATIQTKLLAIMGRKDRD